MQQGAQPAFDGGVRGAPGEADDAVAGRGEGGVAGAVSFERLSGAVGVPAVGFDDEAVRGQYRSTARRETPSARSCASDTIPH
jgi:hypothetical protein